MFENPFSIDRAEHLGDNLYKFYAQHKNFEGLLQKKSLIMEGGRGSGKTMFFLYHSFKNRKKEALNNGKKFEDFLLTEETIGVYFRADAGFVTGFQHKQQSEEDWIQLFNHYFNLTISRSLCEIAIDIKNCIENFNYETECCNEIQLLIGYSEKINNYNELLQILVIEETKLIRYINNIGRFERPITTSTGYLINTIVQKLLLEKPLVGKIFHVFVDEYENLLEYQQRLINTLIKHPKPMVIDVGMRKEGLKTNETLAKNEVINFPHDFTIFDTESFSDEDYENFIIESCFKRFKTINQLKDLPDNSPYLDIRFYLGKYSSKNEIKYITSGDYSLIKAKIKEEIKLIDKQKKERIYNSLTNTDDPIILRLNLSLLLRKKNRPEEIAEEFEKHQSNLNSKYADWIHNNKAGAVFLLCKDYRKKKQYFGINAFIPLSSGIIRYFLEFCESAFKNAFRNGFSFDHPRAITMIEQTSAVSYVSEYKISDIDTYPPYSSRLKRFTILLGNIFEAIHKDQKLSEPERNHFATEYDQLEETSKAFLKSALQLSVLQQRNETKDKSGKVSSNQYEYHLNHVYAPYFQISYRKQRKLDIAFKDLDVLINGNAEKAKEVANRIAKKYNDENIDMGGGRQLDLTDTWISND